MQPELTLARPPRHFLPDSYELTDWAHVQPFYDDLLQRPINSADDLRRWFADRSELESYLSENFAWRYIRMTCDTASEALVSQLNFFIETIQPPMSTLGNELDQKALASPYLDQLDDEAHAVMVRGMKQANAIFREENIPLQTEMQTEERKYSALNGAMTVVMEIDGIREEVTLQKATDFLQSTDRSVRENAWFLIQERRFRDHETLDALYDTLVSLRHQIALNAGFDNYRDYAFAALGRFDYTPADCFTFHQSVAEAVVPLLTEQAVERKAKLQRLDPTLDGLRPWDSKVDPDGHAPLVPFATGADLVDKTIRCFDHLDPSGELGGYLRVMRQMGHLDLESRKGKAPGGYNYPLEEIGVPFIFMNATSSLRDLVTMVHEGGHAVHSFLTRELPLKAFRNPPMEVAELASMAMELISMDHWDVFFTNPDDLRRARLQHLESIVETLPWVATIDKFQHWVYEHPAHTHAERRAAWVRIFDEFADAQTDWSGLEHYKEYIWQKQLHLYEVPFYYIEYGIAQLGAIGVWRNYRRDAQTGLRGYKDALKLGYQAPIGAIYAAANVPFDFSKEHIGELMAFLQEEIARLKG
ncbi:oligoendopeptidase, M3 family [Fibrella aestuarina BUZ 2]|uniref:Oligoendopeptidase, M3 family n=1 Tax=Fibrella aestuarina BUZ 2 TaxID=1166018 RepID=I0K3P5_9BACT|nr:M3 family oligoendopeptidase [Fibrella aestuarina]CCG98748.1 oligoendopeptidase, M3 family [Fibrella aestuarina BUZ 2]